MIGSSTFAQAVAVAVGSLAGGLSRWAIGLWLNHRWSGFPLGTLAVNCVGGLLIGMALMAFDRHPNELLRLLFITGFLGGLTTFSAFSGESLLLLQRGDWGLAALHTFVHVAGALAFAAVGFRAARWLLG